MDVLQFLALLGAGMVAGGINAVVGSGTLVSFPTLLAFGYPTVLANVTNNVGILPGSVTGAIGVPARAGEERKSRSRSPGWRAPRRRAGWSVRCCCCSCPSPRSSR